jgi:hypothetical protein
MSQTSSIARIQIFVGKSLPQPTKTVCPYTNASLVPMKEALLGN